MATRSGKAFRRAEIERKAQEAQKVEDAQDIARVVAAHEPARLARLASIQASWFKLTT
jgi:predicted NAD-dependent protein-ADP-ribosyltransferase YbiA (DUF1768 family)